MPIKIVKVALDLPARKLFDYALGADAVVPAIGSRVLVPFRNAERLGIIMQHAENSSVPEDKIKSIRATLADLPPLPEQIVKLLSQAASLNQLPAGKLAFAALPPLARKRLSESETPKAAPPRTVPQDMQLKKLIGVPSNAANTICRQLNEGFSIHLLSGVPSSGKQDVAVTAIAACIRLGRTVLVLAPNITDAQEIHRRLQESLPGCAIALYHSDLKATEQLSSWRQAKAGQAHVVVGTRSAVFSPLADLGLIWVVNENDPLHRAEQGLMYSARDIAALRGRITGCPVLMTAATPSVELRHAALSQRLNMTTLPKLPNAPTPRVTIIDIAGRRLFGGISVEMENALRSEITRGGLSAILINRRGHGSMLFCPECRHLLKCPQCHSTLTQDSDSACVCRRCGYSRVVPQACPACGGNKISPFRPGSARVAETLANRLPQARIAKADKSTDLNELRVKLDAGEIDIIVGTNLLLGLRLQANTVVISDADSTLHGPNYRAAELLLDTVTKLTAHSDNSHLLVQTCFAEHHLFESLTRGSYETFAFAELKERKAAGLPPFRRLALLTATGPDESELARYIGSARRLAKEVLPRKVSLMEPTQSRQTSGTKHSMQLLISAPDRNDLLKTLNSWLPALDKCQLPKDTSLDVIVDPEIW